MAKFTCGGNLSSPRKGDVNAPQVLWLPCRYLFTVLNTLCLHVYARRNWSPISFSEEQDPMWTPLAQLGALIPQDVQGIASRALQPIPGLAAGAAVNSTVYVLGLSILLKGSSQTSIQCSLFHSIATDFQNVADIPAQDWARVLQ